MIFQRPSKMATFLLVADADFFPGLLAAVASVRCFHPAEEVIVIDNHLQHRGLSVSQHAALQALNARVIPASALAKEGRKLAAWEIKAYAAEWLSGETRLLVGLDADAVLCAPLHDVLGRACWEEVFLGGKDRCPAYGEEFRIYGIETPVMNDAFMSTSLYVCRTTPRNQQMLAKWAACCAQAVFGGTGNYPGHGDQGVLNAILFSHRKEVNVCVLDNELWSQHHVYWQHPLEVREGRLFNVTRQQWQRVLHCGGTEKFWRPQHAAMLALHPHAMPNYLWFLHMLRNGLKCCAAEPAKVVEPKFGHLLHDMLRLEKELSEMQSR